MTEPGQSGGADHAPPGPMDDEPAHERLTARLLRREALRRAAMELSTVTPAGLESVLARISAEVTADAAAMKTDSGKH